jgi:hypothetical protein
MTRYADLSAQVARERRIDAPVVRNEGRYIGATARINAQ